MIDYSSTWGHTMLPMEVAGAQECKYCGTHYVDDGVCPESLICECVSGRRNGFRFVGVLHVPIYVCVDCGFPTADFLAGVLRVESS